MQISNLNQISRPSPGMPGTEPAMRPQGSGTPESNFGAQAARQVTAFEGTRGQTGREQVEAAVEQVQRSTLLRGSQLSFQIDDSSERLVVRILDPDTRDVIRQIPSEDFLRMAQALQSFEEQALSASVELPQTSSAAPSGMLLRESA